MRLHELVLRLEKPAGVRSMAFELRGDRDVELTSVAHDSRDVTPGALFFCIPGAQHDGHEYATAAVRAGAAACVAEHQLDVDVPQVLVESVREAIGPLCARFFDDPSRHMRVLGVTGTNGKTTTTYLLGAIAREAGDTTGVIGTTGACIGAASVPVPHTTPEATDLQALLARMRAAGVGTVAMEVSSHALDQHRADGTVFRAACFTNLSHDHLDYHGSIDAYFDAKARLFRPEFTSHAAINVDDDHGRRLAARARDAGIAVRTYAIDAAADVTARDVQLTVDGSTFAIVTAAGAVAARTRLIGRFNVMNALAAFTTATAAGVDPAEAVAGLARPVTVPGRLEPIPTGDRFSVYVDYAHTPDALASVLAAARPLVASAGRLIVVFGCGGDRDRAKRPVMGEVAARAADVAYLTSDNPRSEDPEAIARDVLTGVNEARRPIVELDRRAAIRAAVRAANAGDVVIIAGKGHETGQTAQGVTVPFDDRVVAREELEARA